MPNPPVPRVPRDALPPAMQAAHDRALASRGDTTFVDVLGHTPELFEWYGEFYSRVFYGGRVPVRIKELIRLRLSTVHGCAFCNRGIMRTDESAFKHIRNDHFQRGDSAFAGNRNVTRPQGRTIA